MASKKLPVSSGYFNKDMQAILKKGEKPAAKKSTAAKKTTKK